jgi:hypothetical protein
MPDSDSCPATSMQPEPSQVSRWLLKIISLRDYDRKRLTVGCCGPGRNKKFEPSTGRCSAVLCYSRSSVLSHSESLSPSVRQLWDWPPRSSSDPHNFFHFIASLQTAVIILIFPSSNLLPTPYTPTSLLPIVLRLSLPKG